MRWKSRRSSWEIGGPTGRSSRSSAGIVQVDQLDARGDEQVDDPGLGRLHDRHAAGRAAEEVRALVVLDADPHPHIGGRELDITALAAGRSDGGHEQFDRRLPRPR